MCITDFCLLESHSGEDPHIIHKSLAGCVFLLVLHDHHFRRLSDEKQTCWKQILWLHKNFADSIFPVEPIRVFSLWFMITQQYESHIITAWRVYSLNQMSGTLWTSQQWKHVFLRLWLWWWSLFCQDADAVCNLILSLVYYFCNLMPLSRGSR